MTRKPTWLKEAVALGNQLHFRKQSRWLHNAINLGCLAGVLGVIAGAVYAVRLLPVWAYVPVAAYAFAWTFFSLNILVIHEASHGMLVCFEDRERQRRWNRVLGWAASIPFFTDYGRHWEYGHPVHHARPMVESDPQVQPIPLGGGFWRTMALLLLIPGYGVTRRGAVYKPARWVSLAGAAFWLVVFGLCLWRGAWPVMLALVLSFQVLGALNWFRVALEHGGDMRVLPLHLRSRTTLFYLRWLTIPFNLSIHFEHHLNPCVPWYRLKAYHRQVRATVPAHLRDWTCNHHPLRHLNGTADMPESERAPASVTT